ncbi:MAG: transglutaminase domain-containing protein, partial [Lentimicrobiaceae bacterium]|nr:transglutaminase domain-containing protein [Lentimicrobiaceae bacterium]
WCHEKVTYRPSDGRTSSPLATIRTGLGRCGEESTLTVTAMRAMGIPARQCYTPRWAHTDDNHAWVEVWVDGNWHYLGACEPEPELDMAWFTIPATRAMMVHSNVFGKCNNLGERNLETELYSVINMLSNYTNTKQIEVFVTDKKGAPIQDATVKFKLYNYAEYYTLAAVNTDNNGRATLTTGYGDLLVWATKNEKYGYQKFDVRTNDRLTIVVDNEPGKAYLQTLDILPPEAATHKKTTSKEQTNLNNKRLQYEDSLRNAYINTFMKEDEAKAIQTAHLKPEQLWFFIQKSEGNYMEIKKFIEQNGTAKTGLYIYEFLNALSDKDLRDAPADILQEHITLFHPEKYPVEVYFKGILPARIAHEGLRFWRHYLQEKLTKELGGNPTVQQLMDWMEAHLTILPNDNYYRTPISPKGVFDLKLTDSHSQDIFLVAACRALDIPAYWDGAINQVFVWEKGAWKMVRFEEKGEKQKAESRKQKMGRLVLNVGEKAEHLQYWVHYTIAKYIDGDFVTFDYEDDPRVADFPATLELESGYYMLSTGNRYSDGETLSQLEFFNIAPEETVNKTIALRELKPRNKIYGKIDVNYKMNITHTPTPLLDLMPEKELVVCFIDPAREPTRHLFNDIARLKSEFQSWNGYILFFIPEEKQTAAFNPKNYSFPKNAIFSVDEETTFLNYVLNTTSQNFREEYPLVFIINKEGKLVFKSEGYRIGTGELLLKSLKKYW